LQTGFQPIDVVGRQKLVEVATAGIEAGDIGAARKLKAVMTTQGYHIVFHRSPFVAARRRKPFHFGGFHTICGIKMVWHFNIWPWPSKTPQTACRAAFLSSKILDKLRVE
jgi:hypothetical protein